MMNPLNFRLMKNRTRLRRSVLVAGVATGLSATVAMSTAQDLEQAELTGWYFRVDASARFNLKASVKELPLAHSGPGIYDNGFVLPDVSGTASGLTWNWGYDSASQVIYDAANQPQALRFSRLENFPTVGGDVDLTSPMLEGEAIGGFRSYPFLIGKHSARVGFEVGYGYFGSSRGLNLQASGTAAQTIDNYRLNGVVPPVPPYAGTFYGPGPLMDLYPDPANSGVHTFPSTTSFQGSLDTTFHNFRAGPSFSIDLTRRFNVQVGAGWDSLYAHAEVKYQETSAHTPNPATIKVKKSDWRPGFYAELLMHYQINKHLQVFLGGDFRANNDLEFSDSLHEYTIKLGSTYSAKGGLTYAF